MRDRTLADESTNEKLKYVDNQIFDSVVGAEIRESNEEEWGDIVVIFDEEVVFEHESEKLQIETIARRQLKKEDEFYFEKVMYKHPYWTHDTVCVSFESLEDNVFRGN